MAEYKLTQGNGVLGPNGEWIPPDIHNRDRRKYEAWLAEGNSPNAADPLPKPITEADMAERQLQELPGLHALLKLVAKDTGRTETEILAAAKAEVA